jgi:hypothetical protein
LGLNFVIKNPKTNAEKMEIGINSTTIHIESICSTRKYPEKHKKMKNRNKESLEDSFLQYLKL